MTQLRPEAAKKKFLRCISRENFKWPQILASFHTQKKTLKSLIWYVCSSSLAVIFRSLTTCFSQQESSYITWLIPYLFKRFLGAIWETVSMVVIRGCALFFQVNKTLYKRQDWNLLWQELESDRHGFQSWLYRQLELNLLAVLSRWKWDWMIFRSKGWREGPVRLSF